jgi:hypothetical protein
VTKLQFRMYQNPGAAELFITIPTRDGDLIRASATLDTGAEVTVLPDSIMESCEYRLSELGHVIVQQAGIAHQVFEITEAYVTLYLEDEFGNRTQNFEAPIWFTDTDEPLLGFKGILDEAIFCIDMRDLSGYLDINH